MGEVVRLKKAIPAWDKEIQSRRAKRTRDKAQEVFAKRKFSSLSAEEKDQLLAFVAERLGLVLPG
jgi:hypothetical protein